MQADGAAHKRLTEREIVPLTREALDQGRTKQQVFEELAPRFYSREHLAQLISTVPDVELRKRYARTNRILVILTVVTNTSHLGLLALGVLAQGFPQFLVFDHTIPLIALFFVRGLQRMRGGVYIPAGVAALIGILDSVRLVRINPWWSCMDLVLFTTTAVLSFRVGGCLFPQRGWSGPRKDENGNYLL
jgi:hypothetical protein